MRELKERVKEIVKDKPANIYKIKKIIMLILQYTKEVSSDDVRFYVKTFDPSTLVIGTAFKLLVEEGVIVKKGTKKSDIRTSKGRDIAVYKQP